jgi:hypothetical protein
MNEPCHQRIEYPKAWTPEQIGGKAGVQYALSTDQFGAIDSLLEQTRDIAPQQVTRAQFEHPALQPLIDMLRHVLADGAGMMIVCGLTPERYTEDQMHRVYWGIGTHLGDAVVQNQNGDRITRVEKHDNPNSRGYRGTHELTPHTDSFEWIGLMCVRQGASGGLSGVASALAVHNEILKNRPDLLAPLYEGYEYALPEMRENTKPVTDLKIPVFCCVDDVVSCMIIEYHMRDAARAMGLAFPADLDEALNYFVATVARPDINMQFMLEPGEMMFLNNFTTIHSRTAFTNAAQQQRLWLNVPNGRAVVPGLRARAKAYEQHFEAIRHEQVGGRPTSV